MTELGEGTAAAKKLAAPDKGAVKVIVKDICTGDPVQDAKVTVNKTEKTTSASGEAVFSDLPTGVANVTVSRHFADLDYSTFIVHYPRVLNDHEAKSVASELASIEKDKETTQEVEIDVFKLVGDIVFHRRHISFSGGDKYGHWWTMVDASKSYGWWPKYPMGSSDNVTSTKPVKPTPPAADAGIGEQIQYRFNSAVYSAQSKLYDMKESSLGQTLRGVEGELNGQTSFGGTPTRDPHHIDSGDEQFKPVRKDCFDLVSTIGQIDAFAASYPGGWSWRLEAGNHCHTFQKELMKKLDLDQVKVIK